MRARRKPIFLICHVAPYPPSSGIQLRIYRLLRWLKREGYPVVLILASEFKSAEKLRELRKITYRVHWTKPAYWRPTPLRMKLGRKFPRLKALIWESVKPFLRGYGPKRLASSRAAAAQSRSNEIHEYFVSDKLTETVAELARRYRPSAVIAEYIFATPLFDGLPPDTLKIVDTIDVFSVKEDQILSFGITNFLAASKEDEQRYLLKADVVVAIQSREAELLRALVPERRVILAGVDFDVVDDAFNSDSIPARITIVASDNPLNVHGLSGFLEECWPAIKQSCPAATLHIVGLVGQECHVEDPSILYSGWVADLDAVYREASVVINPAMAGTGLKIKSVEALAHGKPLVAWSNGVEGLKYEGQAPFVECASWAEYRDAIIRLLTSKPERIAFSKRALAYARHEFDATSVYAELRDCLESANRADTHRVPAIQGDTVGRS